MTSIRTLPEMQGEMAPDAAPVLHPWFAIRVKSRRENVTAAALRGKGVEEFAPTCPTRNRWSDRVKDVDVPLFPGYIFCRFDPLHRLPVITTPGIVSIVGLGKTPLPVEDAEIARIQTIVSSGAPAYPWPYLRVGQKVTIRRGPLTGIEGFMIGSKDEYRLVVSIQLLQRSVATEIDRDCVEASR
jgi:transcription antitermination factor NusG